MKLAICVPVHRDTRADFTFSMARALVRTARESQAEIEIIGRGSSMIAFARNWLVGKALESGADHILWADDDHVFPPDAILRLMHHDLPMVGCNYLRRTSQAIGTAAKDGEPLMTTRPRAAKMPVEEVDSIGLGLCLLRVAALRGLTMPLFDIDMTTRVGEDVYFCRKLRAAGVKIHVDHALSLEVEHITEGRLRFPA